MGIIAKGSEYTVALSAHFKVLVKDKDIWQAGEEQWLAEEEAWDDVQNLLKHLDSKEYEIWGVADNKKVDDGYNIEIRVDFKIFVVDFDVDEAYNKAVDLVDNLTLPENVRCLLIKQTDLVEVGEPVYMVNENDYL